MMSSLLSSAWKCKKSHPFGSDLLCLSAAEDFRHAFADFSGPAAGGGSKGAAPPIHSRAISCPGGREPEESLVYLHLPRAAGDEPPSRRRKGSGSWRYICGFKEKPNPFQSCSLFDRKDSTWLLMARISLKMTCRLRNWMKVGE